MPSAGQVDELTTLFLGVVLATVVLLTFRAQPQWGVLAWIVSIAFVPVWVGVSLGAYLPLSAAVAAVAAVALVTHAQLRIAIPDVLVLGVVVLSATAFALGEVSLHALFVTVTEWGLVYLLARLAGTILSLDWIYKAVAVVMAAAAALALVEFATGTNLFVEYLRTSNAHYSAWSTLQERGGILRAEGAFGHSIALGASLALAVPLALVARLRPGPKVAVVSLLVAGAVVSFSRIGIGTSFLALLLSLILLGRHIRLRVRVVLTVALVLASAAAIPAVGRVFDAAGDEAQGSAQYRGDLFSLVPDFRWVGTSFVAERDASGILRFGGFRSIDSAVVYAGLTYGWLILAMLVALYLAAVLCLLRKGGATAPAVALAAQMPALLSVALITQYAALLWFVGGLATTAYVKSRSSRHSSAVSTDTSHLSRLEQDVAPASHGRTPAKEDV